jgi:hypothetical protein
MIFEKRKTRASNMPVVKIKNPMLIAFMTDDRRIQVRLDPKKIGSAAAGGIILADLARHFARALPAAGLARSEDEALKAIWEIFEVEMKNPTDLGEGSIVN